MSDQQRLIDVMDDLAASAGTDNPYLAPEAKMALTGLDQAGGWMLMSASELGSPRNKRLAHQGYVQIEAKEDGVIMWRITPKGRARIEGQT